MPSLWILKFKCNESLGIGAECQASTSNSGPGGSDPFRSGVSGAETCRNNIQIFDSWFYRECIWHFLCLFSFGWGLSGNNVTSDSVAPAANLFVPQQNLVCYAKFLMLDLMWILIHDGHPNSEENRWENMIRCFGVDQDEDMFWMTTEEMRMMMVVVMIVVL